MKKIISSAFLTLAFIAMLCVINTNSASASVWLCDTGYASVGAWAHCSKGSPSNVQYRVGVLCAGPLNSYSYYKYGNWTNLNSKSQTPTTVNGCNKWYEHYVGKPTVSSNK
jgi:hypothetical protein